MSQYQLDEIKECFDLFDTDGNTGIYKNEMKVALKALGFEKKEEINKIIKKTFEGREDQKDAHGQPKGIQYEEFLTIISNKLKERDPMEEMIKAFRMFDDDDTGTISFRNLKRFAKELGENMTDEEINEMLDEAHPEPLPEKGPDGKPVPNDVSREEFFRIMSEAKVF